MNPEIDANAMVLLIIMATAWWTIRNALNAQSSDPNGPGRSRAGPTFTYNQHLADLCVHDGHSDILLSNTDRHGDDIAQSLELIRVADPSFDTGQFLDSGCLVYETVVMAFANGDRELLQDLVSSEVYEAFSEMISKREQRCERVELSFVCLEKAEIANVGLFNKQVQITIDFLAKLVTVMRAKTGQVIAGDPTKISNVSNLWTFARELIPSRKARKLVETEST